MDAPTATALTAATQTASSNEARSNLTSDYETFLRMLTTQMENQDPLDPMESTELSLQLATFSGVEQQVQTNELLASLGEQLGLMNLSQLSGWVGMEARSAAPALFSGAAIELYPDFPKTADRSDLVVKDAQGHEVFREAFNPEADAHFWNGKGRNGTTLPEGLYSFHLQPFTGGAPGELVPVETYAEVGEVQRREDGPVLVLPGGAEVAALEVTAVRAVDAAP